MATRNVSIFQRKIINARLGAVVLVAMTLGSTTHATARPIGNATKTSSTETARKPADAGKDSHRPLSSMPITDDSRSRPDEIQRSGMTCECSSMFKNLHGLPLAIAGLMGFLLVGSTISALISLSVFLIRRSRV